ncbi:MAG TPA: PQQ-dependent dehydrogenase, methanol/ethanol family [Candidatus Acidoferrum sp.]|nr:PQQ-dependent dehydrogenase, methanol/ethanol family [Candidatus Acidoferrum sp.]
MSHTKHWLGLSLLLPFALAGAQAMGQTAAPKATAPKAAAVDQARLLKGTSDPHQWPTYGGSYNEQHYSPLAAINTGNVKDLGLAWFGDYDTNQTQYGTPLYVDGVIYVSTARNVVHAFDAHDGKRLWTYTPLMVPKPNLGLTNKGLAAWNGKIYMGMLDAHLVAIDAATGKQVWNVDTVPDSLGLGKIADQYSITIAPRVAKGLVFIGGSGGEYGARGWIAAYNAETGKEVWRFWTVPGDPAKPYEGDHLKVAAKTWRTDRKYWEQGGGGTIWDAIVYDPVTDLLYFGTGNGTPWNRKMRDPDDGDNLFTASIVAVKPETGKYVWHYQETPGDSWDYDAVSPMMTADLKFNGKQRHVILQPSKNGFMYVLDAASGQLISGDAFTGVTWAEPVIDLKTGRPNVLPGARYETAPYNIGPGAPGGHTWHPNAFSPRTGLIYIPTWENYSVMTPQKMPDNGKPPLVAVGGRLDAAAQAALKPHNKQANDGWLQAWDPIARKAVWETPRGPRATSGVLATAGDVVFMGNSNGNTLAAYDAKTGTQLWSYDAQSAVYAAPITYELDGVQYIAASVGGASANDYYAPSYGRMLVFKVGGNVQLPAKVTYTPAPLNPPPSTAAADVIAHGNEVYSANCAVCHGNGGVQQRSSFPNLTRSPLLYSQEGFDQVVLKGVRAQRGMANYSDKLAAADAVAVREYIISRANELKNAPPPSPLAPPQGAGGAGGGAGGGAAAGGARQAAPATDIHEDAVRK